METRPEISAELEDTSYVSPPPGSVPTTHLPLTFFDILYLVTLPRTWMQRLFVYESKRPVSHFTETILPELKTSLSRTLQHFFPFAGNVVFPPPPRMPYIIYEEGDAVSFVVTKFTADFNHLVGDHARDQIEFQALLPKPPLAIAVSSSNECKQEPAMAIQITLFPDVGFSIGIGFSHSTFAHFMKSWASINNHSRRENSTCLDDYDYDHDYLPCFDRDLVDDPLDLTCILMKRTFRGTISQVVSFNNFRVTYKLKRSEVELLKTRLKTKCSVESIGSDQIRMSTFVTSCAYMWVCLIKLQQIGTHQHLDSNDVSYFHFPANCRDRIKLPETYFGNCLILRLASAKKCELLKENGIAVAATAIGREIMEFRQRPFKDAQVSLPKIIENYLSGKDTILAVSSSKFGFYKMDFGYGRPRKTEIGRLISFGSRSMLCIADSGEEDGGVEFGLTFASHELDSFNAIFMEGLLNLQAKA